MPTYRNILIVAEANPKAWGILCLSHDTQDSKAPNVMCLDGILMRLVGWACNTQGDFAVYLQLSGLSRSKQLFALRTAFRALKEKGYRLELE